MKKSYRQNLVPTINLSHKTILCYLGLPSGSRELIMFSSSINSHEGKQVDGRYNDERKIKKGIREAIADQLT